MIKEAYLYKKLPNKKVQCQTCAHYCVIAPAKKGKCGVRQNKNGKLYSLVYGKPCAVHIDPIEKKPFFHFLPGKKSLSIATVGCNFACENCQNYTISQPPKSGRDDPELLSAESAESSSGLPNMPPEKIIEMAIKNNLPSISYTYTEPTVFVEYALDTMKLAKKEGIKNTWVSNGFWSKELFNLISPYLEAANIDLKSFSDDFYRKYCDGRLQPVLETLKRIKEKNIWLEITTLVIPSLNDKEEEFQKIAEFIKNELGSEVPWHITQFSGAISWKLQHLPDTPIETLKKAYKIGKEIGLKYVYTGNVPGLVSEDTYCPKCNEKMIERTGYFIKRFDQDGKCSKCGENLNIIIN